MAFVTASKLKIVVKSADGSQKQLKLTDLANFKLVPGMQLALIDEKTGHPPKGLYLKRSGQDLVLELPELGPVARLAGYYDQPQISFYTEGGTAAKSAGLSASTVASASGDALVWSMVPEGGTATTAATAMPATVAVPGMPAAAVVPGVAGSGGLAVAAVSGVPAAASASGASTAAAASEAAGVASGGGSSSWLLAGLGGLGLAGAGGGGGGGGVVAVVASASGLVVDGYIVGATVTRVNSSGNSVLTDASGHFTGLTGTGPIKITGGIDASTGQAFTGTLIAPEGAAVITPVTTLIQAWIDQTGVNVQTATAAVMAKLGLPSGFDVLGTDPVVLANQGNNDALNVFKAGAMVATALQVISGGNSAQFGVAAKAMVTMLNASTSGLTGADLVVSVLKSVVDQVASDANYVNQALLTQTLQEIDDLRTVSDVAGSQATLLGQALDLSSVTSLTFTAAVDSNVKSVSFGGDAGGPITVEIAADGSATFMRAGVQAKNANGGDFTVAKLADESGYFSLDVVAGTRLVINVAGSDLLGDVLAIRADQARGITLAGSLGGGQDSILIKIADESTNSRVLMVNTKALADVEHVVFDFADVNDIVVLTADSYLANIGTIEVKKGSVDVHLIEIPAGTVFVINSGLTLTLDQYLASESISSLSGLGRLTLLVNSADDLVGKNLSSLNLVGFGAGEVGYVVIKTVGGTILYSTNPDDAGTYTVDPVAEAAVNAIQEASLPSVTLLTANVTAIEALIGNLQDTDASLASSLSDLATRATGLESSLNALGSRIDSGNTIQAAALNATKAALQANIDALNQKSQAAVSVLNSQVTALQATDADFANNLSALVTRATNLEGALTTLSARIDKNNTAQTDALNAAKTALTAAYTAAIDTAITNLNNALQGGVSTDYNTFAKLAAKLTSLQGAIDTINGIGAGSITKAVTDSFNTLTANYNAAINTAITNLQTQLNAGQSEYTTFQDVATKLKALQSAIDTINGSGTGSITKAVTDAFNLLTTNYTTAINTAINNLDATLKAGVSADYDTFKEVATKLTTLQDAIDTINGSGTGSITKAVTDAFNLLTTNYTAAISTAITNLSNTLKAGVSTNYDTFAEVAAKLTSLQSAIDTINGSSAGSITKAVTDSFNLLTTNYTTAINNAITTLSDTLKAGVSTNYDTFAEVAAKLTSLQSAIDTINGSGTGSITKAVTDSFNKLTTNYTAAITNAITTLSDTLKAGVSTNYDTFAEVAAKLTSLQSAIDTINSSNTASAITKAVTDSFNLLTTNYTVAISNAITILGDTLRDGVATDYDTFKEVATKLTALQTALDTINGSGTGSITKAVTDSFNKLTTNYNAAISTAITTLSNTLKDGVSTDYDTFKEVETKLLSLQSAIDTLNQAGGTLISSQIAAALGHPTTLVDGAATGLWAGIESAITAAQTTLQNNIDALATAVKGAGWDTAKYQTLVDLSTQIGLLKDVASVDGSVANSIAVAVGTPTTGTLGQPGYVAATGLFVQVEQLITTAQTTLQDHIDTLATAVKGTGWDTAKYQTLADVSAQIELLQEVAGVAGSVANTVALAVGAPTTGTQGQPDYVAATGLFVQVEQLITAAQATLQDHIDTLATAVKGTGWDTAKYQTLADVSAQIELLQDGSGIAGSVANSITAAVGAPTVGTLGQPGYAAATGLFVQVEGLITTAIDGIKGGALAVGDYSTIKALSDAVKALETGLGPNFTSLVSTLQGRGSLMSVLAATTLQTDGSDPLHILLTNYRVSDTASAVLGVAASSPALTNAKNVIVSSGTIATAADASGLVERNVDLANSSYNLEADASILTAYASLPAQVVSNATDIHVTGDTNLTQANTLLGVANRGTTTFEQVTVKYNEVKSLAIGANDIIKHLTITGLDLSNETTSVDLSGISVNTALTFSGLRGKEVVTITAAPASNASAGVVSLSGGDGDDKFYVIESVAGGSAQASWLATGSAIHGGNGADTLTVRGTVDLSGATLDGLESLVLETGSPSHVTLTAAQLAGFSGVTGVNTAGSDSSVITIIGADSRTTTSLTTLNTSFTGISQLQVGSNVTLALSLAQLQALDKVVVNGSGVSIGQLEISGSSGTTTLTHDSLDLSAIQFSGDWASLNLDLNGHSLTVSNAQANGATLTGSSGNLLIKGLQEDVNLSGVNGVGLTVTAQIAAGDDIDLMFTVVSAIDHYELLASSTGTPTQLTLGDFQVNSNVTVTGTGKLYIENLKNATDLSGVSSSLDVTALVHIGLVDLTSNPTTGTLQSKVDRFVVDTGASLTLTAAQANAKPVSGGGTVYVQGSGAADLSQIATSLDVVGASGVLTFWAVMPTDSTLTLRADQANGRVLSGASGTVKISSLHLDPSADFSKITASSVQIEVSQNTVFTGNLGHASVQVDSGIALTLTAAQADAANGINVASGGSVLINSASVGTSYDFSDIVQATSHQVTVQLTAGGTLAAGTNLGVADVTMVNGSTLTLSAAQVGTGGRHIDTVSGTGGKVVVTGAAAADLSGVMNHGTLDVTGATGSLVLDQSLAADQTLVLRADQLGSNSFSAAAVGNAGTLVITDPTQDTVLSSAQVADDSLTVKIEFTSVSGSHVYLGAWQNLTHVDEIVVDNGVTLHLNSDQAALYAGHITGSYVVVTDRYYNGTLSGTGGNGTSGNPYTADQVATLLAAYQSGDTIRIAAGTLTAAVTALDGALIAKAAGAPSAAVVVTGGSSSNVDLRGIRTDLDVSAASLSPQALLVGQGNSLLVTGQTLTLTAAEANGRTISGSGTLVVTGNVGTDDVDLTGLVGVQTLSFTGSFDVASGKTLKATVGQITGHTVTGAGTLQLQQTAFDSNVDLSGHSVSHLTFSANGGTTTSTALTVSTGHTLTLTAAQVVANGLAISGTGTVSVLHVSAGSDLSGLTATHVVAVMDAGTGSTVANASFDNVTDLVTTAGVDLTLSAGQAHGLIASGAGVLHVADLGLGAAADLSQIAVTGGFSADFLTSNTFDGQLGSADVTVASSVTMTLSATKASGHLIHGTGAVTITGLDGAASYDFDQVTASTTTATVSGTVALAAGTHLGSALDLFLANQATLSLSADQFANRDVGVANGATGTHLTVTGAAVDTVYDFSKIAAGIDTRVDFSAGGTVSASTNFSGVDSVGTNGGHLVLTGAQANGVHFDGGGSVDITASSGVETLYGSTGNDTIHTSGNDTVNLAAGGTDTVVWSGPATDFVTVQSFGSGVGGDVLDFSQFSLEGSSTYKTLNLSDSTWTTAKVIGFSQKINDADSIESALSFLGQSLGGHDKVFLIANSGNPSSVNVWHWVETASGDNQVQAAELTNIGTLVGLQNTDIPNLNFIV